MSSKNLTNVGTEIERKKGRDKGCKINEKSVDGVYGNKA